MLKNLLICCLVSVFSLCAQAGTWSFGSTAYSTITGGSYVNAPYANDTASEQIAYATPHGFPNNWLNSPGTSCTVVGAKHKYFTVTSVTEIAGGRPVKYWRLWFYVQECVN